MTLDTRSDPRIAVVTIAHGRHEHLRRQHLTLAAGSVLPDAYVVVAMGDAEIRDDEIRDDERRSLMRRVVHLDADPSALPLAQARNLGAETAIRGGADALVFLDVDCLAGEGLVQAYGRAVRDRGDVLWSGPVTYLPPPPPEGYDLHDLERLDHPHPARPAPVPGSRALITDANLFWSLSFAVSVETWTEIGGFHEGYTGYGAEDTDFAHAAVAAGAPMCWDGSARAFHQHHAVGDPLVQHLPDLLRNGELFRRRWGRWPMSGWFEELERGGHVRRAGDGWVAT